MTEAEWNTCTDPEPMLEQLCSLAPSRSLDSKLRILGCGFVRRVWDQLVDPRARSAIEVAERYSRMEATPAELDKAFHAACDAADEHAAVIDQMDPNDVTLTVLQSSSYLHAASMAAAEDIRSGAIVAARLIAGTVFGKGANVHADTEAELARQAQLIRDLFGIPRPISDESKTS